MAPNFYYSNLFVRTTMSSLIFVYKNINADFVSDSLAVEVKALSI